MNAANGGRADMISTADAKNDDMVGKTLVGFAEDEETSVPSAVLVTYS